MKETLSPENPAGTRKYALDQMLCIQEGPLTSLVLFVLGGRNKAYLNERAIKYTEKIT